MEEQGQEQAIRAVRRLCAAGLDSVTLRRQLMRHIARVVPYDAYAFSTCDPDTGLMAHTLGENVPPALARAYIERLYPSETAIRVLDRSLTGSSTISMLDACTAVADAFRAYGLKAEVHLTLVADRRLRGTACLIREHDTSATLERASGFLERAAPVIARGLKSAAAIDEARATIAPSDVSATTPGVLVLDANLTPIVRTAAAMRWLRDLADIGMGASDDLPLSVLDVAARLRRVRADVPDELIVWLRGASGRWYTLRGSLAEPDASGASTIVIVIRPAARREVAWILTRLYGLSKREREVVAAVGRGETTKCIAAALGVSPYTVEEHLDRACRKIGVRGRKALVAKIFVDGYAAQVGAPRPGIVSDGA